MQFKKILLAWKTNGGVRQWNNAATWAYLTVICYVRHYMYMGFHCPFMDSYSGICTTGKHFGLGAQPVT